SADTFEQWQLANENLYIIGDFVWSAMDYLGESGMGAWKYATPEQVAKARLADQCLRNILTRVGENGHDSFMELLNRTIGVSMADIMSVIRPGYPWHA